MRKLAVTPGVDYVKLKKKIVQNNTLYQMFLDEMKVGPLDGGCWAMAQALYEVMGGSLFSIVDAYGIPQHIVLRTGPGVYLDADGPSLEDTLLDRWEEEPVISPLSLRPFQKDDVPESPRSYEFVNKIVEYLES